jgi:hypothetical protein
MSAKTRCVHLSQGVRVHSPEHGAGVSPASCFLPDVAPLQGRATPVGRCGCPHRPVFCRAPCHMRKPLCRALTIATNCVQSDQASRRHPDDSHAPQPDRPRHRGPCRASCARPAASADRRRSGRRAPDVSHAAVIDPFEPCNSRLETTRPPAAACEHTADLQPTRELESPVEVVLLEKAVARRRNASGYRVVADDAGVGGG